MKVYIDQPRGKEKLVAAFVEAGAEVVTTLDPDVKLIIPTVEETLPFFARAKDYFASKGIRVMVNNPDVIDLCRNKAEFYRVCRRHGIAAPATMQDMFVVKPVVGKGSQGVQILDRSVIVQEYIPFPEYSIDYFADFSGKSRAVIQRLRLDVVNGESQKAKIEWHEAIHNTVKQLGQELGLVGHNVFQGWYTGQTFIMGEINCRFGGGSPLTFDIFHSPRWLIENGTIHNP